MNEIKLHLGCGKRYIPGFVHIDIDKHPHIDHVRNIFDLSIFEDNSVDLIYSCGTLEYFDREEVVNVLKEWKRVLKNNGILRLSVPDFESIVKVYKKYNDLDGIGILGPLYGRIKINTEEGEKVICHKTVYDFNSLKKLLESVGFKNVRKYDWEKTIHKDYDDFSQAYVPHMDKKNGILMSLNVEADK